MTTTFPQQHNITSKWYSVDASNQVLGKLAVRIAKVLMGKHEPSYSPHIAAGTHVVVTNAEQLVLTGNKSQTKSYKYHTGYVGGLKEISYDRMQEENPEMMLHLAVKRMLPKNTQGRHALKNLRIFRNADHSHTAQKPAPLP